MDRITETKIPAGKSTLLRAVNGLNPVARGHVEVATGDAMTDVTHADAKPLRGIRQKSIAMVFQQFGLLPWRSLRENVWLGLELARVPTRCMSPPTPASAR